MDSCKLRTPLLGAGLCALFACASANPGPRTDPAQPAALGATAAWAPSRPQTTPQTATEAAEPFDGSLRAYIDHALAHSSKLAAAEANWQAAVAQANLAGGLPDPHFSYGELIEPIQTRTGPQERRIGISQSFPWPGQLGAEQRAAEQRAQAVRERFEGERGDVISEVTVAFHEYGFLGRQLSIRHDLLEILRGLDSIVQSRVRSGGRQADLLRLQVEVGRLEDELASLKGRRSVLSARLEQASERFAVRGVLPIPEVEPPDPVEFDRMGLRAQVMDSNPMLREMQAQARASQEGERAARLQTRPGFTLGVMSMQTGEALNHSTPGSGDDPLLVSLSFSLPVWSGKNEARRKAARQRARASMEQVDTAQLDALTNLEQTLFMVEDAARRIRLFQDSLLPRASEALDLTLSAYRTGNSSVLDLIDSERTLLEFKLSLWQACRDYSVGEAHIHHLIGHGEHQ